MPDLIKDDFLNGADELDTAVDCADGESKDLFEDDFFATDGEFVAPKRPRPWALIGIGGFAVLLLVYIVVRLASSGENSATDTEIVSLDTPGAETALPSAPQNDFVSSADALANPSGAPVAVREVAEVKAIEFKPMVEKPVAVAPSAPAELKPIASAPAPLPAPAKKPAATTTSKGEWSVQLASMSDNARANSEKARLTKRFASQLGARTLSIVPASSKGQSVYRVRVVGLDSASALQLCENLKSAGGTCFATKK